MFGVAIGNSLTSVYSLGIAASFIFKNAASSAFDAIMFIFVTQYVLSCFLNLPTFFITDAHQLAVHSILATAASLRKKTLSSNIWVCLRPSLYVQTGRRCITSIVTCSPSSCEFFLAFVRCMRYSPSLVRSTNVRRSGVRLPPF